ncbi:MAG TPA: tRNA uridine-5-carboxymethylaminomethyl(34) synthesis GTPase MnmE, partial [Crenalkalicoccus sp.]|nr:tRNA uridine-5-carboxymethylaminomethyl(34) synthesis GTPase MnmE [Crenalkalicoccus sp.]
MDQTIFALASGAGRAAVAVMRLSGPGSAAALRALSGTLPAPRRATLRRLRHPETGEVLDRALLLWFPGPRSYTGEDAAELHLHGGPAVIAGVAEALLACGARPAEPGEFTRRAFLNGKLDLTAAEGIADLVAAETAAQRRQALRQADGALATLYEGWTARLTVLLARQEAFIEFEEEDLPGDLDAAVAAEAAALRAEIAAHMAEGARAERLREGLEVAILGAPNAGKSSLLNALVGREAAIVSARAGTTRDVVEARLDLGGVPVTLADTAGLREAADEIEAEGVRRARRRGEEADLVLALFAADRAPDEGTLALLGPDAIVVASKVDLAEPPAEIGGVPALAVSVVTGAGLGALRAQVANAAVSRAGLTAAAALTRP